MIQETIALEKATGRADCGEEFPPDDRRVRAAASERTQAAT